MTNTSSSSPTMAAVVAYPHAAVLLHQLLTLGRKNLDDKRRDRKDNPFDGYPPPSDEYPPEEAVMLVLQLGIGDNLRGNVVAFAFRANHIESLPYLSAKNKLCVVHMYLSCAILFSAAGEQHRKEDKTMNKREELKMLIVNLLNRIDDERMLRAIYRYINDLFCKF